MSRSLVFACLAILCPSVEAAPLTEEHAVRRALENVSFNMVLEAEQAAATATAAGAGRLSNPQVGWTREELTSTDSFEDIVQVSQNLDVSGRLGLESAAAEHEAAAVEHRQQQARANRVARARQAFFATLFEQERHAVLKGWRARLAQLARAVRERAEAGDAAEYEARRLEAQLSRLDATLVIAATERESTWTDLVVLMGEPSPTESNWPRVQGALLPEGPPRQVSATSGGVARRGDIAALEAERAAAGARERAASRWWVPRLSLQGGYKGVNDDATNEHGVVVGVGIELPLFEGARGEDERQAAIVRGLAAQQEAMTWAATQRLRERERAVADLLSAAQAMNAGAAQAADELAGTARQTYLAGELSVVELLDAHHNALETKLEVLALELRARNAVIELGCEMGVVP